MFAMKSVVLPGNGIGPMIMAQALISGAGYEAKGDPLPEH